MNKIIDFPCRIDVLPKIKVHSLTFSNYDIMNSNVGDDSGGESMNYITREEFNRKMEVVDLKFEKLEDKIDNSTRLILS